MKNKNKIILCLCALINTIAFAHPYKGSLEVLISDDFNHHTSHIQYKLNNKKNSYYLNFTDLSSAKLLKTGDLLEVDADKVEGNKGSLKVNKIISHTVGAHFKKKDAREIHNLLGLIVNFKDVKTSDQVTVADMNKVLYTNDTAMQHVYQRSSMGIVLFNQDTNADGKPDNYIINLKTNMGACNPTQWANDALQAAKAKGINLNLYQHFMFVLPEQNDCPWDGIAHVGCDKNCWSFIRGYDPNTLYAQHLYGHEFGHNLGLFHSGTDLNNDGVGDDEYGDESCLMGLSLYYKEINAPHRDQMKWFVNYPKKIKAIIPSSKRYVLEALESGASSTGLIALKVRRNDTETYYISFRRQVGPFGQGSDAWNQKISIHYIKENDYNSYFVKTLAQGESLVDLENHITITVHSINEPFATVSVYTA